ncbi:hypothetical protein [Faecalibacterium sp.]|uniref:hypothetical protein n=1 Tax=Faecalibacterium sp. TaxID=1971605 RepID=UPI00399AC765
MMMPANFSAVNAEVVYGGAVADYLPNAWTAANVKQFFTNVITLVSNSFQEGIINATLGTMFGGNWGGDDGLKLFGSDGTLKTWLYGADAGDMSFLNKTMRTLGLASFVYTLGTASAKVGFNKEVVTIEKKLIEL